MEFFDWSELVNWIEFICTVGGFILAVIDHFNGKK